ncbi:hypothetical protein SUGI_0520260 [Cryptomeria japonica]|nr:hypothetical protein SUGI_0520260 [Cryptomeria japonica]
MEWNSSSKVNDFNSDPNAMPDGQLPRQQFQAPQSAFHITDEDGHVILTQTGGNHVDGYANANSAPFQQNAYNTCAPVWRVCEESVPANERFIIITNGKITKKFGVEGTPESIAKCIRLVFQVNEGYMFLEDPFGYRTQIHSNLPISTTYRLMLTKGKIIDLQTHDSCLQRYAW